MSIFFVRACERHHMSTSQDMPKKAKKRSQESKNKHKNAQKVQRDEAKLFLDMVRTEFKLHNTTEIIWV